MTRNDKDKIIDGDEYKISSIYIYADDSQILMDSASQSYDGNLGTLDSFAHA